MISLIGNTIDRYQILVKIRETPTRVLYKAYNTASQNYIALEVVKTSVRQPDELLRLINDQINKNIDLSHPNIATTADAGLYQGMVYIVYNFTPIQSLRRFFNRTYSWQDMARELVSITHALGYAHEKGIIHGSLHPSSIVLDEKRNPILFGFGFEQIITGYILAHTPGTWINRWGFEYRAPEVLSGAAPDKRSDIYAIGIMLYEWLIGKIPLLAATVLGTLEIRLTDSISMKEAASVPPVIQTLIQKCTAFKPAERYQSMQEVYIVLARGALDMSITKRMVRKPLEVPVQRFRLKPQSLMIFSAIAILAIFIVAAFMSRSSLSAMASPPSVTPTPSKILPTPTMIKPTATAAPTKTPIPTATATLAFPVFQETPFSSAINQTINADNIGKMILLSHWGIGNVNRLVPAPNGEYLVAASSIGIFIFNAQSLKLEKYIDTSSWVTTLDFSPDGKFIAIGNRDGSIQVWDTNTWQESGTTYSGHTQSILDLAFSPNGTKLASVALDNSLIEWTINSTAKLRAETIGGMTAVAYSADNTRIITGGNDFQINVWDAESLKVTQTKAFSSKVVDIASIKGTNLLVIGGSDQKVALLDITSEAGWIPVGSMQYPLTGVAASPDKKLIAAGDINGGISIWDITDRSIDKKFKEPRTIKNDPPEYTGDLNAPGSPHSLAFSPDGKLIFSGLHNGTIRSLAAETGEVAQQNLFLNTHTKKMAVSHNSQYLITQQDNYTLTVWDLWKGIALYQFQGEIKPGDPFSPDDSVFAVASVAGPAKINIYDPSDGKELYSPNSYRDLKNIQFTKDGAQLVTVYDKSAIHLWATSSWQELDTSPKYVVPGCVTYYDKNNVEIVSVTITYQHVIADNNNRPGLCGFETQQWTTFINEDIGLLAYGGGEKLAVVNIQNEGRKDQNMHGVRVDDTVVSVALSPNGKIVAAAYADRTIHLWGIDSQNELMNLYGHNDSITDLRFTPDGKLLISTSLDGTIRLWGVP